MILSPSLVNKLMRNILKEIIVMNHHMHIVRDKYNFSPGDIVTLWVIL